MDMVLKTICRYIGTALSMVVPWHNNSYLRRILNRIYSGYLSAKFKTISNTALFDISTTILNPKYLTIGSNSVIGKRTVISAWPKYNTSFYHPQIVIGDNVAIGDDCHISAVASVIIGSGALLGKKITIVDNSHGRTDYETLTIPPLSRDLFSKGCVKIGENVWIGDKVTICPNVVIGDNAIIGANSVVTKNVPAFSVACGNPAKIVKHCEYND